MDEAIIVQIKKAFQRLTETHKAYSELTDEQKHYIEGRMAYTELDSARLDIAELALEHLEALLANLAAVTRERDELRGYISDLEHMVLDVVGETQILQGIRHVPYERTKVILDDIRARYTDEGTLKALERQPRAGESERTT